MRHSSRPPGLLAAVLICGPLLAGACTSTDSIGSGGDRDADMGGTGGPTVGPRDAAVADGLGDRTVQPDANPLCETLTCFSACQKQIPVVPTDQPTGFTVAPSPSYVYDTQPLGSDQVIGIGSFLAEIRNTSDLSLVSYLPLPAAWSQQSSAVAGQTGFVRDGHANIAVLDLADPAAPRATAWWLSAGSPVGGWRGKLVLAAGSGTSFIDVSNPLAPIESFCLPAAVEAIAGDTLVAKRSGSSGPFADIYHLDPVLGDPALWATIKIVSSPAPALDGTRLAVPVDASNLALYELGGAAPVKVAQTQPAETYYTWQTGGFFFGESADQSQTVALDLRGALSPYSVSQVAGNPCLTRLDALDGSGALVVSRWLPGARFSPDLLPPVQCPEEDTVTNTRGLAALSPDGHTLLLPGYRGWVFRDLDTGTDTIRGGGSGYSDSVDWVGDHIVEVGKELSLEGSSSWAWIYDAANPASTIITITGLDPYTTWLGTSGGQMIGIAPGPGFQSPSAPAVWALDPQAATVVSKPIGLPSTGSYTAYLWDDKLVVFDGTEAIVLNLDGTEQGRITLPSFVAAAQTFLLTDLGWFAITDAGEILRFDPASSTVEVGVTGCVDCWLLGADSERLYVRALGPDALAPLASSPGSSWDASRNYSDLTYSELRAYAVTKGYPLVGRYPLPASSMQRLLIGSKLALVGEGALLLTAPP